MSGAVVIRRCASAEEAAIVCALLNDAGIPASLENWYHAMIDWGVMQALSGVGVLVPASEAERARGVIVEYAESADERLKESFPELESGPLRPNRLRQFILIGYFTGILLVPLILLFMLIELVNQALISSSGGPFRWDLLGASLAGAEWGQLTFSVVLAASSFLVPFGIFLFLTRQFLARRTAMKATS